MEQNDYFLIKIIYRHRIFIFSVALLSALTAAIATSNFFMQPVYSSEIVFYPPSAAINRSFDNVKSFMVQDKEIEEHLQTILSGKTQNILISKYRLAQHYNIDTLQNEWRDDLKKEWGGNFKVSRTLYNSISIIVYDINKNLAAQIANDAAFVADSIKSDLLRHSLKLNSDALKIEFTAKLKEVETAATALGMDAGTLAFAPPLTGNNTFDLGQKQGAIFNLFESKKQKEFENKQLELYSLASLLRQLYDMETALSQLQVALSSPPLSSFILSKAEPSFKKTSPKRTLITIIAFFGGLFFAIALMLLKEQWNKIKVHLK